MKSMLSTGLVALLCATSVAAGGLCSKTARGSNRVVCHLEAPFTYEKDHHRHHHHKDKEEKDKDKDSHKHEHKDIVRGVESYSFSFLLNYTITDDCSATKAHLTSILPVLSNEHHKVKCRLQVRWGHGENQNQSWDYVGQNVLDWRSFPAKMEWPLPASYDNPDRLIASKDWGVKYESAHGGETHALKIHSDAGNDFSHSWGPAVHGDEGHNGHQGNQGFQDHQDNGGHKDNDGFKDKADHKDKDKKTGYDRSVDHYSRTGGHYNTKKLYSCWVFEKLHHRTEHEEWHGHHHDKSDKDDKSKSGDWRPDNSQPVIPHRHDIWTTTCEPRVPPPACHEEEDRKDDSCGSGHESNDKSSDDCNGSDRCAKAVVSDKCKQRCSDDDKSHNGSAGHGEDHCSKDNDSDDHRDGCSKHDDNNCHKSVDECSCGAHEAEDQDEGEHGCHQSC